MEQYFTFFALWMDSGRNLRYSAYRYLLQMPLSLDNCPPTARAGQARGDHYLACVLSFIPPHAGMTRQREGKNMRFDPNKDL